MKDKYDATGSVIEYYEWIGKYGIWIWLCAFSLFCFVLVLFLKTK